MKMESLHFSQEIKNVVKSVLLHNQTLQHTLKSSNPSDKSKNHHTLADIGLKLLKIKGSADNQSKKKEKHRKIQVINSTKMI